jgi:uncharacterized membrane protein YphA (DoxX/SURF4 family)
MTESIEKKNRVRSIIALVASILMGLTFVMSGSGKTFGFGEMPGQTMHFLSDILPDFLFTPEIAYFIGYILLPYIIPLAELGLGLLLLLQIWPRLIACIASPLIITFIANNSWLISKGNEFPSCECFGIWEEIFGMLTPAQSLVYDIVLLGLALIIIFVHPGSFSYVPRWLARLSGKDKQQNNQEES